MLDSSADLPVAPRASVEALLSYAWGTGVFTSGHALQHTGLTRSTAIEAIDELIEMGLLRELPNARAVGEYRKGRPSRRFELDADAAIVIGMDAGRGHLTTTVADLRGKPLWSSSVELDVTHDTAAERRTAVADALRAALAGVQRDREDLLAICAGVPAPVNADGESPPSPREGFWQRMNPDLTGLLSAWAPIVRVDNDASLAAVAEGSRGAAVGCEHYVTLLAGERLGAGVVIDGRLLRGVHGGAGEAVGFEHVTTVGSADGIDHRVVEWARTAIAAGDLPRDHALAGAAPERVTIVTVLDLAAAGDSWANGLLDRVPPVLARVVGTFGSFFDPERVIVSGAVPSRCPRVVEAARVLIVGELDLPAPRIIASTLGPEVVVIGAVSAALEAARSQVLHVSR